jgi:hypothetical protein
MLSRFINHVKQGKGFIFTKDFFVVSVITVLVSILVASKSLISGEALTYFGGVFTVFILSTIITELVSFKGNNEKTEEKNMPLMLEYKWDFSKVKNKRHLNDDDKTLILNHAKEKYKNNPTKLILFETELFDKPSVSLKDIKTKISEIEKIAI